MFQKITSLFKNQQGGGINSRLLKNNYQKTSKAIAFLFCVIFFVFLPVGFSGVSKAKAATYYVDGASGDDTTGTGAQVQPWKTLIKAETAAANGDTVNIKSGTYIEASSVEGSSGNIIFTKAIAWMGKGSGWAGDGTVTVQGKTPTSDIIVAGNTNITSFTNFTFDAQNARSRDISVIVGHANKTFTNCTFENSAGVGYPVRIGSGSTIIFNNCNFSYNGGSGGYIIFTDSTDVILNNPVINRTGSSGVIADTGSTSTLSILNGSITVTGGDNTHIISWQGGITINGTTINTNTVNGQLLNSIGAGSTALIEGVNVTHNMSGTTGYGFYGSGTSLTIQDSIVNISGGLVALSTSGISSTTLKNSTFNFSIYNPSSILFFNSGTGSIIVDNNHMNISLVSGNINCAIKRNPANRSDAADFKFINNILTINAAYSYIILVTKSNCNLEISNNIIDSTSLAVSAGYVIGLYDIPNPVVTNNTITTSSTNREEHIVVVPSDVTNWLGTGIATISGNTSYTKSQSGHVIALGEDGSSGSAYEQRWNGSIIENNTIYGPAYFGDNGQYTTHDIFIGNNIKCFVRHNKIIGGSLGFVIKSLGLDWQNQGGVYGNVIINSTYGAILSKGSRNLNLYNNTIFIDSAYSPAYTIAIGENLSNYPTTGNKFFNNVVYSKSANKLIYVDSYSVTNFQAYNNIYWNELGDLTQQVFEFNNVYYTGFNAWNTAIGGTDNSLLSNPRFNDIGSNDATLQYPSSAIDAGTSVSFTTDYLGNHIYGTPDIGAYEYQPPYTITTDNPNISSPIRIYADGKYRYTNTTSGSTNAKLSITPQAGFGTGDCSQWMDVTVNTWHTSSDYYKSWTESSPNHTLVTNHTIGDLKSNAYYTLKLDTVNQSTYLSNGTGQISFTYSGGYSTHTFELTEDTTPPASFTPISPANNFVTSERNPSFSWNSSFDTESGLNKYQLYIDGIMDTDNILTGTTYTYPTTILSCGNHSWYIKAIDNNNNTTNSNTFTLDINCAGGFIPSPKPIVTPTDPTLGTVPSNITQIAISRTPDFTNISWQPFDKDKFKNIDQTTETLYVKFRTDQGAVSDTIIYTPQAPNQTTIPLNEGDIVKTPNNPDVYVIKHKNNKQYKRLILSPLVFKSYQHLKWENIKIISQEQLDKYTTSNLVKETIDTIIYLLFPNGDTGERKEQDTSINYDSDSVYEINVTDRDSYKLVK